MKNYLIGSNDELIKQKYTDEVLLDEKNLERLENIFSNLIDTTKDIIVNPRRNGTTYFECSVDPSFLMKAKGGGYYGDIINDNGKICRKAKLFEVTGKDALVLSCFQATSLITGQYYQQTIKKELEIIQKKLDKIIRYSEIKDEAQLVNSFNIIQRLYSQEYYAYNDYVSIDYQIDKIGCLVEQYRKSIADVLKKLRLSHTWFFEYLEARQKVSKLENSDFFYLCDMALSAEMFYKIAISIKIKMYEFSNDINHIQNIPALINELNINIKDYYDKSFCRIANDILIYLKLSKNNAWVFKGMIQKCIDRCNARFTDVDAKYKQKYDYISTINQNSNILIEIEDNHIKHVFRQVKIKEE